MVILPFLAVFTTLRALFITPTPNLDSSAVEMVNSLGCVFDFFVFMIYNSEFMIKGPRRTDKLSIFLKCLQQKSGCFIIFF